MAIVRMSSEQAWAEGVNDVDRTKLARTTEADVLQYMIEDGEDPEGEPAFTRFVPPAEIRAKLDMTQVAFAEALAVPVKDAAELGAARTARPRYEDADAYRRRRSGPRVQGRTRGDVEARPSSAREPGTGAADRRRVHADRQNSWPAFAPARAGRSGERIDSYDVDR